MFLLRREYITIAYEQSVGQVFVSMMKKILINDEAWQTRVAVTWNNELQNIYFSSHATQTFERAFYKGVVTKVLPGIQTAFVDIGQEKAGFLHISEIDRDLAINKMRESAQLDDEEQPPKRQSRSRTDIGKIFKEGDQILVQVSKEPVYEKGAKLSTCFILPGRFIVLMPNIPRIGISKKIGDTKERTFLREFVRKNLPEGMGCIIRTTSEEQDERAIIKDIEYLVKTWEDVQQKFKTSKPKERVHEDIDLPLQIIRDHLDNDVEAVITDSEKNRNHVLNFVKTIAPEFSQHVQLYTGKSAIFDHYDIEKQIEEALQRKVPLKSGGSLIIESAEAMTVVDVNTGRFIGKRNLEDTILKTNMEAAEEIVRQLRLRNIGGLIIIDFIDMAIAANRRKLSQHFENTLRERDKFQSVVLQLSEFGLAQMTRKRSGKTLVQELMTSCTHCTGHGVVKSIQAEGFSVMRILKDNLATKKLGKNIALTVHPDVFEYLTSTEYNAILRLENQFDTKIALVSDKSLLLEACKIQKD